MNQIEKAKKRVELAKEVLHQFKIKKMIAKNTVYSILNDYSENKFCDVCATGALAVACCGPRSIYNGDTVIDCLKPYFLVSQIELIEVAFEKFADSPYVTQYNTRPSNQLALRIMASKKYSSGLSREDRLKKIMRNIIRNEGTFII